MPNNRLEVVISLLVLRRIDAFIEQPFYHNAKRLMKPMSA